MKQFSVCLFLFVLGFSSLKAQIGLTFQAIAGHKQVNIGDSLRLENPKISLQLETLRFYISNVKLSYQGALVYRETDSYHLWDLSDSSSWNWELATKENIVFDSLHFTLGIDSATNVSGAYGGDLDPTKGMYWSWQSGYINFKLEANCPACPRISETIMYHLGGYMDPFPSATEVNIAQDETEQIILQLDLAAVLSNVDFQELPMIMSPGEETQTLSRVISEAFSIHE